MRLKTNSKTFTCNGLIREDMHPSEGHPLVYLTMKEEDTEMVCPYCSTVYEYDHRPKD